MSLKQQARDGVFWTFLQQFGTQIITFIVGVVLARLLTPSDFGTVALFMVVITLATSIIDGGMASSLIRTENVNDKDLSTVFWFNIATSLAIYLVIYGVAPIIAIFYDVPILTPVIRVYSVIIIINSLVTVQNTRYLKAMDFRTPFRIQLPSLLIGGVIGVVLALYGFGIWSLVYYAIFQSLISTIQFWTYSKWRPSFIFDRERFKFHFFYGYKLTLSGLLDNLFKEVYTIVIGKYFSTTQLGYYNRAYSLRQLPVANLSAALNKVTFPLFAQISSDDTKLKNVSKKIMNMVVFVFTPTLSLLIVVA